MNTITIDEYFAKEAEFARRHDSLCENISPALCDCSKCPTRDLCKWLEENRPYK